MLKRSFITAATFAWFCGMPLTIHAASIYNEAISGDLSNNGLKPTVLSISAGSNQILGTTGRGASGTDRDYFTVSVAPGFQISQFVELAGTTVGDAVSFLGVEAGTQVTLATSATTADGLLGWVHYGPVSSDTDLLPLMGVPSLGSTGFTGPLPAGDYAFWIQDFGAGTFAYDFDIRVSATPEPGSYLTAALGLAALARFLKKKPGKI